MYKILLLCIVAAAAVAEDLHLSAEQKEKAIKHSIECISETGADTEVVSDAKNGKFSDNEDLKSFMFCFFQKTGIISSDGELKVDVAVKLLPEGADKEAAEKLLNDCKTKTGSDEKDTAYEILKCYVSGTNQRIVFD